MIKIIPNQHFNLFIIGLPSFTHDFRSSFIYVKPITFLFNWPYNFSPSIKHISLYMRGRLSSSNPVTIFWASSTILMSSLDVWSSRICCESSCFFSHSFYVSYSIFICYSKWFFKLFINWSLRPFIAEISSSKLFSAAFTIFSLFSSTLKRTCRISNSTFSVLSNFSIPLFTHFFTFLCCIIDPGTDVLDSLFNPCYRVASVTVEHEARWTNHTKWGGWYQKHWVQ